MKSAGNRFLAFVRDHVASVTGGLVGVLALTGVTSALLNVGARQIEYNCEFLSNGITNAEILSEFQDIQLSLQEATLRAERSEFLEASGENESGDRLEILEEFQRREIELEGERSDLINQKTVDLPKLRTEQSVLCAEGASLAAWIGFLNAVFNIMLALTLFSLGLQVGRSNVPRNPDDDD